MTPPENKPTKPTLWEQAKAFFNSKPWGFLGWLISILLGVWLFFAGQRNPLLTYAVWPVHAPIVRSQSFSDLKVLYKGAEVHGDISLASVEFQNLGAGPILGAPDTDILSPIYIQLEGDAPILEASVQKMTRSLIEVSLDQSKASSGRLGLGWKILEQNDGFIVQITYVGPTNTRIQVTRASGTEIRGGYCDNDKRVQNLQFSICSRIQLDLLGFNIFSTGNNIVPLLL